MACINPQLDQIKRDVAKEGVTADNLRAMEAAKPAFPPIKDAAKPSGQALNLLPHYVDVGEPLAQAWSEIRQYFSAADPKIQLAAWNNASKNKAGIVSTQKANNIRDAFKEVMGNRDKIQRGSDEEAMAFIKEAQGDKSQLDISRQKILAALADTPKIQRLSRWTVEANHALKAIDHAEQNFTRLDAVRPAVEKVTNDQIALEHLNGMNTPYRQGYIPQMWKGTAGWVGDMLWGSGSAPEAARGFLKMRDYPTIADGIAAGETPQTLNAVDLIQARVKSGMTVINHQVWAQQGKQLIDPTTMTPIMADPKVETNFTTGKAETSAPNGYELREMGGRTIAVHDGYAGLYDAFTSPSMMRKSIAGRVIIGTESLAKHGLLLFDSFHLGRLAYYQMALRGKATFQEGLYILDYEDGALRNMERRGELTNSFGQPIKADDIIARKADAQLLLDQGYNTGRIADAMYADIVKSIPMVGEKISGFNQFVFQQFQRGGMMESGLLELQRQRQAFPELSDQEVARKVSRELNTRFGNMLSEGWMKSDTARDLMQLLLLAPSWNEGLLRSEFGAGKDLMSMAMSPNATLNAAMRGKLRAGALLKGSGTLLLGTFAFNQLINFATRGQPTWMNKEEGYASKISAWIPDPIGHGPGYFLNPFALPAEITHQILDVIDRGSTPQQAIAQVVGYKLSPVLRAAYTYQSKTDRFGRPLETDADVRNEMLMDVAPIPIAGSAVVAAARSIGQQKVLEPFKGAIFKQTMSSAGIKTQGAPSPLAQTYRLANEFMQANNAKREVRFSTNDFTELNQAIHVNDDARAAKAYAKLRQTKTEGQINEHYTMQQRYPFTNGKLENKFYYSLNPHQKDLYQAARDEKSKLREDFVAMNLGTNYQKTAQ
jgi:hypothetical protein